LFENGSTIVAKVVAIDYYCDRGSEWWEMHNNDCDVMSCSYLGPERIDSLTMLSNIKLAWNPHVIQTSWNI
jgi:hypothetical protein